jgi:hypothetical protein
MSFSFSGPAYQEKKQSKGQAPFGGALRRGLDSASSPDLKDPLRGKQQTETSIFETALMGIRSEQALATNVVAAPKMERIPINQARPIIRYERIEYLVIRF